MGGQKRRTDRPGLLQRAFSSGCTRLAVLGLHPGAGARTVVENVVDELHRSGIAAGVTRAPRVALEVDDVLEQVARIKLPEGTLVATTETLAARGSPLEFVEAVGCRTTLGDLNIYRVTEASDVSVYGPEDPEALDAVFGRLEQHTNGLVIADGAWERRGFAAPDLTQAVILVVGSGYSDGPERSAAAVRSVVASFTIPRCLPRSREAWTEACAAGHAVVLGADGTALGSLRPSLDPTVELQGLGSRVDQIVLPDRLQDEFLGPLTRMPLRCTVVVKDATRLHAAPVHMSAWRKRGGRIEAVEPINLLAVATNPYNPGGADARADEFRRLVAEALPDLPVHDVRLESIPQRRGPFWKVW